MTGPRADPSPSRVVPGLDGIRGVAIILVIMWHCAYQTQFPPSDLGPLRPLVFMGWAGVDLFFALSGFLITGLVLDEERATGSRLDLGRFYARRALRIFPAFYLVLALNLVLLRRLPTFRSLAGAAAGGSLEVVALSTYWSPYYYAYVAQTTPPPGLGVFWSLCVEEHFYLVWPVFLAVVRSTRLRALVAVGVCAVLPLARLAARQTQPAGAVQMLSHFRMDSLLWGALAALLLPHLLRERRTCRLLLAASMATLVALFARGHLGLNMSPLGQALGLTALALFGSALGLEVTSSPNGYVTRTLSLPPLRIVGRVSYGMYLIHFLVIDLVAPPLAAAFRWATPGVFMTLAAAVVGVTFALAAVQYRFYERPFLRLKRRFTPPRQALEQPAA